MDRWMPGELVQLSVPSSNIHLGLDPQNPATHPNMTPKYEGAPKVGTDPGEASASASWVPTDETTGKP